MTMSEVLPKMTVKMPTMIYGDDIDDIDVDDVCFRFPNPELGQQQEYHLNIVTTNPIDHGDIMVLKMTITTTLTMKIMLTMKMTMKMMMTAMCRLRSPTNPPAGSH